jgi:hypothetical protein
MAQFSTGLGLAVLGGCILGAAALTSHKFGSEAMAQGTGTERRIVAQGVYAAGSDHMGYRVWSDNTTEVKFVGYLKEFDSNGTTRTVTKRLTRINWEGWTLQGVWQVVDDGTSAFLRADVDASRSVDTGDISAVLLEFGEESDNPPPPIDCTINSPR